MVGWLVGWLVVGNERSQANKQPNNGLALVVGHFLRADPRQSAMGKEVRVEGRGGGLTEAVPCRPYLPRSPHGSLSHNHTVCDSSHIVCESFGRCGWEELWLGTPSLEEVWGAKLLPTLRGLGQWLAEMATFAPAPPHAIVTPHINALHNNG